MQKEGYYEIRYEVKQISGVTRLNGKGFEFINCDNIRLCYIEENNFDIVYNYHL
jgi:hypothetical protein